MEENSIKLDVMYIHIEKNCNWLNVIGCSDINKGRIFKINQACSICGYPFERNMVSVVP